jgi:lysophospholipase L1-like esterase
MAATTSLVGCGNGFQSDQGSNQIAGTLPAQFAVGVLGDSISRGYDIQTLGQEDLNDNWATGASLPASLVNHFTTVFSGLNVNVTGLNFAVTGDTVLGTSSQLASRANLMASSHAQVVSLEIGANDVCQGNLSSSAAIASFKAKITSVLTTLTSSANPPQAIVVVSIPHIFALTQIAALASNSSCPIAWSVACPNLQIGQTAFESQWNAANAALQAAATAAGGTVAYDGGVVAGTTFLATDVSSIDCFHPSVSGQTKIANAIWGGFSSQF